MRMLLALWVAKLVILVGWLTGKKSSAMPGRIAIKICPDILRRLSAGLPNENIVAVCGTNGKTTTNNLVRSILEATDKRVVCNSYGANMLVGVVTSFIELSDLFGHVKADYAALEIDEASAVKVFPFIKPKYMVITNFFRDQMDRYGEIDMTMAALKKAVDLVPGLTLVINCDDPLSYHFAKGLDMHTYGVSYQVLPHTDTDADDGRFCKECGGGLEYAYRHYSQLGGYSCPKCGFVRPTPDFEIGNVSLGTGLSFDINHRHINVNYRGFYNIYNIAGAYAVTSLMGIDLDRINNVLSEYKPQNGRMEQFDLSKPVILNLSKNPAGFNQAIDTILADPRKKTVIFAVNDNAGDGRDISYLWDIDFERLKDVGCIGLAGLRHADLMVRFKYGGFNLSHTKEFNSMEQAITYMLQEDAEVLYAIVNYTVLFGAQEILRKMQSHHSK